MSRKCGINPNETAFRSVGDVSPGYSLVRLPFPGPAVVELASLVEKMPIDRHVSGKVQQTHSSKRARGNALSLRSCCTRSLTRIHAPSFSKENVYVVPVIANQATTEFPKRRAPSPKPPVLKRPR